MDEAAWNGSPGEVRDSGLDNHGTAMGGASVTTSGSPGNGNAGVFDGIDDSVSTGMNFTATGLTMAAWVRIDALSQPATPIVTSKTNIATNFGVDGYSGQLGLNLGGYAHGTTAMIHGGIVPLGEWVHVAVTWEGGAGFSSYINGVQTATAATSLASFTWNDIQLAKRGSNQFLHGALDEVQIWDHALSAPEVACLHMPSNPSCTQ